jgi:hypothetical protein
MASVTDQAARTPRGTHAADDRTTDHTLLSGLVIVLVIGAGLVLAGRTSAVALLVGTAAVQALVVVGWVFGAALPGRNGALVIGAAASAGSDVTVSLWPHSRLGTLLIIFALAVPLMFVHQLARGAARVRVVESLSAVALLVAMTSSLTAFLQLRHEFLPASTGGHVVAGVLEVVCGALIVGYLVDMIMPAPRFDAGIPRGLLAVVAAAGLGGSVGHLAITDGADFAGARGTFAGAALGAIVAFFAVAAAFIDASTPEPAGASGRRTRPLITALLPLTLSAPVAFLLLLAIRA